MTPIRSVFVTIKYPLGDSHVEIVVEVSYRIDCDAEGNPCVLIENLVPINGFLSIGSDYGDVQFHFSSSMLKQERIVAWLDHEFECNIESACLAYAKQLGDIP